MSLKSEESLERKNQIDNSTRKKYKYLNTKRAKKHDNNQP